MTIATSTRPILIVERSWRLKLNFWLQIKFIIVIFNYFLFTENNCEFFQRLLRVVLTSCQLERMQVNPSTRGLWDLFSCPSLILNTRLVNFFYFPIIYYSCDMFNRNSFFSFRNNWKIFLWKSWEFFSYYGCSIKRLEISAVVHIRHSSANSAIQHIIIIIIIISILNIS